MSTPAIQALNNLHSATLSRHLQALHQHQTQCLALQQGWAGRWFRLAQRGEQLHQRLAPRFVTTVAVAVVALVAVCAPWV